MNVLVLHGPTLAFLGQRDGDPPGVSLAEVDRRLAERARTLGHTLRTVQSNHEGALVDALWEQRGWAQGVLLNPGPLALGSHVLQEAVAASKMPVVEVLLAAKGRPGLQRRSLLRQVCAAQVVASGAEAYLKGLERLELETGGRTKTLGRARRNTAATPQPSPSKTPGATPPAAPSKTVGAASKASAAVGPPPPLARARAAERSATAPATLAGSSAAELGPAPGKTLGRRATDTAAVVRPVGGGLSRAQVRARIAERLSGRLSASGLATWARSEWLAVQRGAPVEAGQRDRIEEVLQALVLSVQPRSTLSDNQLVEWMAALE
jgi:3-dehydroquinate dehydratase II